MACCNGLSSTGPKPSSCNALDRRLRVAGVGDWESAAIPRGPFNAVVPPGVAANTRYSPMANGSTMTNMYTGKLPAAEGWT
jgi:hypothetical protein